MATVTIYSDTTDGVIDSGSASSTWQQALAGVSLVAATGNATDELVAISNAFTTPAYCSEAFCRFNTASLAGSIVTAVTFKTYLADPVYYLEARSHDWGTSLTTADWVAGGATWNGKTKLADYSGMYSGAGLKSWTSTTAFKTAINTGGYTGIVLALSTQGADGHYTCNYSQTITLADASGTTNDPQLVIEYEPASTAMMLGCNF